MLTRPLPVVLLASALVFVLVAPVIATTVVVQPSSQDAFIRKNAPNRIAGANPTNQRIRVQASPPNTQVWRGLVQFSLAGIPFGSTVNSAIAELSAGNNQSNPTLTHGLHRLTATWLQSGVKWNNAPAFVAAPTATALVGTGTGFKSFTVTSDVQAAVNLCAADHGWLVKDQAETATNDMINYVALEDTHPSALADRPKLTVNFTPPPCTTNADCADTNFCTTNEQCIGGTCVVTPVNCDDGNPCTDDICDCASGCINANICNDGFSCTTDTCNPSTLACTNTPNNAVCNGQCSTGTCVADPDSTTIDPTTGCMQTATLPNGTPCNDGTLCTSGDQCTSGNCGGAPVVCTPLDQCHDAGTCNPLSGTCSNPASGSGTLCNDGSLCTQGDLCDGSGSCVGGPPVICTALDQCHVAGACSPGTGVCSNPPSGGGTPCNDGSLCTQTDQCNGSGSCVGGNPVVCTALDQCHVAGTCTPGTGVCSNPPSGGGTPCNDGSLCTQTDQCNGSGSCVGGNPVVCTALDQCHVAGTCTPGTGVCSNPPSGGGTPCNDGSLCTQTDQCNGSGSCVGANPVVCTALDQCHVAGTCTPGTGVCSNPPSGSGTSCNDGSLCTQTDQCNGSGSCVGGNPVVCTALDQCHVAGTCTPGTGVCSNPPSGSGTSCNDGSLCTQTDQCNGSGSCVGGNPVVCTALDQCHDVGTCTPGTGVCSNPPSGSSTSCNDGSLCTQTDQCDGSGSCVGANPVVCTPLDQCHVAGTCTPGTGVCSNPPSGSGTSCNDGSLCTQTDECDGAGSCAGGNPVVCTPLDQCHVAGTCTPGTGVCSNPPSGSGTSCNDGSLCTQTDECDGAGSCAGGNPVVCSPLDQCHVAGTCTPGTGVCSNPPSGSGTSCNDGSLCSQTDQCDGAGSCVGANPVICTPLDQCHDAGTCSPGSGLCSNPPSGSGTSCVDGNACTQTDQCNGAGACVGANPVVCTPLDQCHVAGACDSGTGLCSDPNAANGITCDDGNTCTISDACLSGDCQGNSVTCGDSIVQPGCDEDCDVPGGGPNCTTQCRFICGPTPQTGCRAPAQAKKAGVTLKDKTPDKKDGLNWKYVKGAATVVGDFGTPLSSTNYYLCIYDQSVRPQPLLMSHIPAGDTCPTKPCWKVIKGGFKYNDKLFTPEGIQQLQLKSGVATKAKILVKGKGIDLPMPTLPLTPTVTVQLKNDAGVCWEARYSTPTKNLPQQFRAKGD